MVMTTPEAMMTGKKNTARARLRPMNFSLSTRAIRMLKETIISTDGTMLPIDSVRYGIKKVFSVKKYLKLSNPTNVF